jgi:monoamine oxidase
VFDCGGSRQEVTADHLVLTLPPTTLRQVDLSGISLSPLRQRIIRHATLGTNAKVFVQVEGRPWIKDGYDGFCLTNRAVGGGWDGGNIEAGGYGRGAHGLWVAYPGGEAGVKLGPNYGLTIGQQAVPAPPGMVADVLRQVEPIYPGMIAGWNAGPRLAFVSDPNLSPYLLGAYSNYLVGQYTTIAGAEGLPEDNLHFAGEYTSYNFQGFMEGGVRSGLRAAREIA